LSRNWGNNLNNRKLTINQLIELPHVELIAKFQATSGEIVCLKGENGVGKTQFFDWIKNKMKREFIFSFIDQKPLHCLATITVLETKKLFLDYFFKFCVDKNSEHYQLVDRQLFDDLQMVWKNNLEDLSGGQKQLLKLYLGMIQKADFYFFDEPFHYLDESRQRIIKDVIKSFSSFGKGIIMIDHDQKRIDQMGDRLFEMKWQKDKVFLSEKEMN